MKHCLTRYAIGLLSLLSCQQAVAEPRIVAASLDSGSAASPSATLSLGQPLIGFTSAQPTGTPSTHLGIVPILVSAVRCSIADVAVLGGNAGADGQLTADDIITYLAAFFAGNGAIADVASLGGVQQPDGQITADDVIAFLAAFFAGC